MNAIINNLFESFIFQERNILLHRIQVLLNINLNFVIRIDFFLKSLLNLFCTKSINAFLSCL
jgi:hypothetical protein